MKLRILIAAVCFILPGLSFLSADIYRWTDKQGTVHFGNSIPSDARNVKVISEEISSGPAAGAPAPQPDAKSIEDIVQELEDDLQREREDRQRADEVKKTAHPTSADIITREKEGLEKKILELQQKPLEYFGSQQNKRVRIGYYEYRLQSLLADPDNYFKNPEPFEGNVPVPDVSPSN
ncbi:MAG: DUF4124 domain-containing protein [Deltaproteobacteria bacterium]|nr:DUF4124 domain-containing protein [Deltaproteobacteria bacterium]